MSLILLAGPCAGEREGNIELMNKSAAPDESMIEANNAQPVCGLSQHDVEAFLSMFRAAVETLRSGESQISSEEAKQLQSLARQLLEISEPIAESGNRTQTINYHLTCAAVIIRQQRSELVSCIKLSYMTAFKALNEQHKLILQDRKSAEYMAALRIPAELRATPASAKAPQSDQGDSKPAAEERDSHPKDNPAAAREINAPRGKAAGADTPQSLQSVAKTKEEAESASKTSSESERSPNTSSVIKQSSKEQDSADKTNGGQCRDPRSPPHKSDSLLRRLILPLYMTVLIAAAGIILWLQLPNLFTVSIANALAKTAKASEQDHSDPAHVLIFGDAKLSGSITCYQDKPHENAAEP